MKYLPYVCCLLILVGCAGQSRQDEIDTKWERYDPEKHPPTYDETYTHRSDMNADQLAQRAHKAEQEGRDDKARVDYHAAFRRDRWHPQANEHYQDLMLRNDLFDTVWGEYLDLWQQNPARGDAFWFHVRPMLIQRDDAPIMTERRPALMEDAHARLKQLVQEANNATDESIELAKINEAIEIADLPELHTRRIALTPDDGLQALKDEYAARVEENPASGNAIGLHALVIARSDPQQALADLREGWILDLPGAWLRYALGQVCYLLDDGKPIGQLSATERRQTRAWLKSALAFFNRFKQPTGADNPEPVQEITIRLSRLETLDG